MESLLVENRVSKESLSVWLAKVVITCYFTGMSYYLGHALNQPIELNFMHTLETLTHALNQPVGMVNLMRALQHFMCALNSTMRREQI